jgi:pyruvate dehydrogenase E2 component (dihydrolipoamide acetyltransferase)
VLYAMTGVRAISALPGCPGHAYDQRADKSDPHMSVECPVHEAHLAKDPLWSPSPAHVPLNDAEQKAADEAKAGREKAVFENAASTAAAIGGITQVLAGLVDAVSAMQSPQAPATAPPAPEPTPAPAAAAPGPAKAAVKPRARKTPARASA